jgi:hypothetical protein
MLLRQAHPNWLTSHTSVVDKAVPALVAFDECAAFEAPQSIGRIVMASTYWTIGFFVVVLLCWIASRSNRKRRRGQRPADLARENCHLRHVVTQLAMDKYEPKP